MNDQTRQMECHVSSKHHCAAHGGRAAASFIALQSEPDVEQKTPLQRELKRIRDDYPILAEAGVRYAELARQHGPRNPPARSFFREFLEANPRLKQIFVSFVKAVRAACESFPDVEFEEADEPSVVDMTPGADQPLPSHNLDSIVIVP